MLSVGRGFHWLQLAADADTSVKSASELLDRLIKDIITEGGKVDLDRLVPLLRERIYVKNGRFPASVLCIARRVCS